MRRREFIGIVGGAALWPVAGRAQQAMPRIAVILVQHEADPLGQDRLNAFLQGFEKLGWRDGHNVRIDVRWAGGSPERMREISADFVALKPDVIIASGTPAVGALKRATSSIPVVFVGVNEPMAQGFVASMALPAGNITGFTQGDFSIVGKSVEMLKATAPALNRVGLMYNPETYGFYDAYLERFQAEARWSMELKRVAVRAPADIGVAIKDFASRVGAGLVVMVDAFNAINQAAIRRALEEYPLPHIVPWRSFVVSGGLMSYGPDVNDIFWRSADYVDRILKGAKPAELPVQAPTRYELAINLKTAKALGLDVPPSLLAVADEVIE
jgi:putative ABC transport system substrate-binding protein